MSQNIAIMDFGSSKITVLIGERGVNNTIKLLGTGETAYAGFSSGEFFEPEKLMSAISQAVDLAETNAQIKIKHIFVGVPGEFTTTICRDVGITLPKKRKVMDSDIEVLLAQGDTFSGNPEYTLINSQPIYYTIDDDRRLIEPVGQVSSKISGNISYTLGENKFLDLIYSLIEGMFEEVEFVSSLLAETLLLFTESQRDQYVVFVDVGHITSSVVVARGDGILSQYNFSLGGGHITGDLAVCLEISFAQAESLKKKAVISLNAAESDVYEVAHRDKTESYPAKLVNDIIMERINVIAKTISKCLSMCEYEYPEYAPFYLTGGGLSYISGARDYLSKQLRTPVEIVSPRFPQYNKPHLSSSFGLLDMVLDQHVEIKPTGFFSKLFSKVVK